MTEVEQDSQAMFIGRTFAEVASNYENILSPMMKAVNYQGMMNLDMSLD